MNNLTKWGIGTLAAIVLATSAPAIAHGPRQDGYRFQTGHRQYDEDGTPIKRRHIPLFIGRDGIGYHLHGFWMIKKNNRLPFDYNGNGIDDRYEWFIHKKDFQNYSPFR